MYARFFRPSKALRYYGKPGILSFPMRFLNLLRPIRKPAAGGSLSEISRFDDSWDIIWEDLLTSQYGVYGERTAAYLNYKMAQPGKTYRAYLHRDPSGKIDGYAVMREARHRTRDLRLLKVCDMVGTEEAKRDLLAEANSLARRLSADGVVALSSCRDEEIMKRAGLWLAREFPVGVRPELAGKMHVTFFDSDLDNLW